MPATRKYRTPLAQWLVTERIKRGWSQQDLAREAGTSPTTIISIEMGRPRTVRPATLHKLGVALEVPAEELFRAYA